MLHKTGISLLTLTIFLTSWIHLSGNIILSDEDDVVFVGSGMGSRMIHFGHFETEIFLRHPDKNLKIRNLCDEGNTPGFLSARLLASPKSFLRS